MNLSKTQLADLGTMSGIGVEAIAAVVLPQDKVVAEKLICSGSLNLAIKATIKGQIFEG